jgi:hypothetical protein
MRARSVLTLNREIMDPSIIAPPITEDTKTPRSLRLARRLLFPSLTDLIFIIIIVLAFLVQADGWARLLADGDTGLHIRLGDAIVTGRHVPTHDLFSFSRPAGPSGDQHNLHSLPRAAAVRPGTQ